MNTLSNISAHLRIFSLLFCHSKTRERFLELKYWTVRSQSSSFLFFFIWTKKTYFLYQSECRSVFYSFEKKKRTTVNQAVRFNFKLDTILDSLWNILSIEPSLYFFLYRKSRTLWNLKLKWTAKEREKKKRTTQSDREIECDDNDAETPLLQSTRSSSTAHNFRTHSLTTHHR